MVRPVARAIALNLLLVLLVAAAGWGACKALGWNPRTGEMLLTGGGALAAATLALVPLRMARGAGPAGASQAALVATMVHMLVLLGVGGFVLLTRRPSPAFVYWLMAFYAATLAGVAAAGVRTVRAASPAGTKGA